MVSIPTDPADPADRGRAGPEPGENRLLPLLAAGRVPVAVLAELAAQEDRVVRSDLRSLLLLASRCAGTRTGRYFARTAEAEEAALVRLVPYAAACGLDEEALHRREPLAGCQACAAHLAWLALGGEPAGVVLALRSRLAARGGYCAAVAGALRHRYGFADAACGYFELFAAPGAGGERPGDRAGVAALLREAPDAAHAVARGERYARLFLSYELLFWNTLADLVPMP
jgi:hypothetical protein